MRFDAPMAPHLASTSTPGNGRDKSGAEREYRHGQGQRPASKSRHKGQMKHEGGGMAIRRRSALQRRPGAGKLTYHVTKTCPDVSQFFVDHPEEIPKHPVSDPESWPGGKNIEP
jgi:hypothetical protein